MIVLLEQGGELGIAPGLGQCRHEQAGYERVVGVGRSVVDQRQQRGQRVGAVQLGQKAGGALSVVGKQGVEDRAFVREVVEQRSRANSCRRADRGRGCPVESVLGKDGGGRLQDVRPAGGVPLGVDGSHQASAFGSARLWAGWPCSRSRRRSSSRC
jgi:hypothetical protein